MISFHGDRAVPPELCRLLYQTIPEDLHVSVVFNNGRQHWRGLRGRCCNMNRRDMSWIEICLNPIYTGLGWSTHMGANWSERLGSSTARHWYDLLVVCYHEFGHLATYGLVEPGIAAGYNIDPEVHELLERLAENWKDQMINKLLDHDPRLAQPRLLAGYFGARRARLMRPFWDFANRSTGGSWIAWLVKESRCYNTGGQLSAGDILSGLRLPRTDRAYRWLRNLSAEAGLGIPFVDHADRHHLLYTWGDLRTLRIQAAEWRETAALLGV